MTYILCYSSNIDVVGKLDYLTIDLFVFYS